MSSPRRHPRTWPAVLVILALSVGSSPLDQPPAPTNPATAPVDRKGAWEAQHKAFVEIARAGNVDLLFLGDSITALWPTSNPAAWARYYVPRRPANFSIGGDHTQHLLWRLDHGELGGIRPRVIVLLIGTNNIGNNTEDQVVEGVTAVVNRLRDKLPESKVLLLGIFPRGANRNPAQVMTAPDARVPKLNGRLARLGEGPGVRYLDIGPAFLDGSGQITQALMPDFLHLSRKAYQVWADAMEPTLWDMMEKK